MYVMVSPAATQKCPWRTFTQSLEEQTVPGSAGSAVLPVWASFLGAGPVIGLKGTLERQTHLWLARHCIIPTLKSLINWRAKSMSFYFMVKFQFRGVMEQSRHGHSTLRDNRPSLAHEMGLFIHDGIFYPVINRWILNYWCYGVLFQSLKTDLSLFSEF